MLVSVIIPVYNRGAVVNRTLQTVLGQTYRPLQVVLVDNDSSDNSLEVLNEFKRQHNSPDFEVVVTQESHHSAGAARNRGVEHATGEWIMFFDSDDVMKPRLVERYVAVIEKNQGDLDLISTRATLEMPDGNKRELPFYKKDIFAVQILHSQLATQRYAVRREFFAGTDGWNINLPGWNDWELGLRLLLARPRMAFMGGQIAVEVIHSGEASITGTEFHSRHGQWENVIDVCKTEVRCSSLKNRRRYLRLLDYRRLVLAAQYQLEGRPDLAKPLCKSAYRSLRDSYDNNCQWRWVVGPVLKRLFARIVAGQRGSAQIARRIIR